MATSESCRSFWRRQTLDSQGVVYAFVGFLLTFGLVKLLFYSIGHRSTVEYSVLLEVFIGVLALLFVRQRNFRFDFTDVFVALYFLFGLLVFLVGVFPDGARAFRLFFYPSLVFLIVKNLRSLSFRKTASFFVVVSFLVNLVAFPLFLGHATTYKQLEAIGLVSRHSIWYYHGLPRFVSAVFSPLAASPLLALTTFLSFYLYLKLDLLRYKVLSGFFLLLCILTLSRGGAVFLCVGFGLFFLFGFERRAIRSFAQLVVLVGVAAGVAVTVGWGFRPLRRVVGHFATILGDGAAPAGYVTPFEQRWHNWTNALLVLRTHPLGMGLGTFSTRNGVVKVEDASYATMAVEFGPIGLLLFSLALLSIAARSCKVGTLEARISLGMIAGTAAQAVGSSTWYQFPVVLVLFLFSALALRRGEDCESSHVSGRA